MSQNQVVVKAIIATAVCTVILAVIFFYVFYRCYMSRQRKRANETAPPEVFQEEFRNPGGKLRGLIVDENGRDVIYLKNSTGGRFSSCFSKVWCNPILQQEKGFDDRGEKMGMVSSSSHEIPLLLDPSQVVNFEDFEKTIQMVDNPLPSEINQSSILYPVVVKKKDNPLPPPPPSPPPPPPPPPPPILKVDKVVPPLPPPIPSKMKPRPPPPLPNKNNNFASSSKPPFPPGKANGYKGEDVQIKLKPLHWDKVTTDVDHSMVWNEINDGSFRFDDELMETLFGYNPNKKSSDLKKGLTKSENSSDQIFILDARKSQNTAIILKSLAVSRKEIIDSIQEGNGLSIDVLEKLTRISPTDEESSKILQFSGNPTKLADADSFIYYILKAIPSAFIRINALLFRSCYDPEILHLKESIQTLESSCKELRTRGIFLKLLEAILKAGNRMNAGTTRGNAQGFNLNALRKISGVKSTDGKTTLLQFVVEQVIRSEGRRCFNQKNSNNDTNDEEREYFMLGLPLLKDLSIEFSNVKKAANIDYDSFINVFSTLTNRANEIRQLVSRCGSSEMNGFVREMKVFLEQCDDELKVIKEEQIRVLQLVKKTTEYYQAGGTTTIREQGSNPLQLFGIVKDFLDKVDQVCIEISKKLPKKNATRSSESSTSLWTTTTRTKFQNMDAYFETQKIGTTKEFEDDF